MHKFIYRILYFLLIVFCFWQCSSTKKISYIFPEAIKTLNQDSLVVLCEKGRLLYKEHCTGCHGIFKKAKDGIPDFTKQQIDMYKAKASLRDPTNHAVLQNMPFEQLDAIQLFLLYRKKD